MEGGNAVSSEMEFATFVANQANEPQITEEASISIRPTSAFSNMSELVVGKSAPNPFKGGKQIRKSKAIFGFFGHDPFRAKKITAKQLEEA